jgi:hypothetical protein
MAVAVNLTTYVKVPGYRSLRLRVLVREPAWIAKGVKVAKGYKAHAWFQASKQPTLLGTVALSAINLEYVIHECGHAAWELIDKMLPEDEREEAVVTLTGELATRVWLRLLEVCHEPV